MPWKLSLANATDTAAVYPASSGRIDDVIVSERAERKGWLAATLEASAFYSGTGGEDMSPEDRKVYEEMLARVAVAAKRYDAARGRG